MSDESNNPLASEPPTNTGGGGNAPLSDPTDDAAPQSEPPTNTGGGGSSD